MVLLEPPKDVRTRHLSGTSVARCCFRPYLLGLSFAGLWRGSSDASLDPPILRLGEDNFTSALHEHERVLVQWYKPDCRECMDAIPQLEGAGRILREEGYASCIANVDMTIEMSLASAHGISSPAVGYFVRGEQVGVYSGKLATEEVSRHLKRRERPEVKDLKRKKVDIFFKQTTGDGLALVATVKLGSVRHRVFLESLTAILDVIDESHDVRFGIVKLTEKADAKKDASLTMHRGFVAEDPQFSIVHVHESFPDPDKRQLEFKGAWTKNNIFTWGSRNSYLNIGKRFSPLYRPATLFKLDLKGSVVFCSPINREERTIKPFVKTYPDWKFTLCDPRAISADDKEMLIGKRTTGAEEEWLSVLLAEEDTYKRHVLAGSTIHVGPAVQAFLKDVHEGKGEKVVGFMSEPIPAREVDLNGVLTLTGDTFKKHVMDSSKDVFVYFWHPQCKHCIHARPAWDKLGLEVTKRGWAGKGVVVARMDTSRNDCEEDDLDSLPRFVLYRALAKEKKMKQKRIWWPPDSIETYQALTIERWIEFLLNSAVSLQGEEDSMIEAEVSAARKRARRSKAASRGGTDSKRQEL